jgi:excisionase family DNA binding protein
LAINGHGRCFWGYDALDVDVKGEDFYSVEEAAKVLKVTPGRIRQMLRAGQLEGVPPAESAGRGWKIPMRAVHDRERPPRVERPQRPLEPSERLAELEAEVRDLRYRLGFSEGRLELTQKTESTLREERDRLLEDRDRERERAEDLQRQLEEVRRPWWRKLFED